MTYQEFIQNILDTRGRFACGDEYHERHHIIPKCMNGSNEKENLIDLYAREHFIAHKMLADENPDNDGLILAYTCMAFIKRDDTERYELTPEEYEEVRIIHAKTISRRHTGEGNPFYGKYHTEETKQKIVEFNSGRVYSEETRKKMSDSLSGENNPMFGKHWSQQQIENMKQKMNGENNPMFGISPQERMNEETYKQWKVHLQESNKGKNNPMFGKHHTEESKIKISEAKKGVTHSEETKKKQSDAQIKRYANPEERKKQSQRMSGENHPLYGQHHSKETKQKISFSKSGCNAKHTNPIINVDTNQVYYSSAMAGNDVDIDPSSILKCCKGIYKNSGGYNWKYVYDYITKDGEAIPGAITLGIITEEEVLIQLNIIKGD